MGGGGGLRVADLQLAHIVSAPIAALPRSLTLRPPHPPYGHPLPNGARGETGTAQGPQPVAPFVSPSSACSLTGPRLAVGIIIRRSSRLFWLGRDIEVKHFFAQYPGWGIGRITDALISPSEAIAFDESSWNIAAIQARFRQAVDAFAPDYVMITDAWNMKPYLAEAVRGYPYYLLYQAQENICPLNNLRLLATGPNTVEQCPRNQLATPEVCCRCLAERGRHSGALHRAERELAGVGTQEYYAKLRHSLSEAEAVLVLNPVIAALVEPYCSRVRIVPWGMDARFRWRVPTRELARCLGPALGEGLLTSPTERPQVSRPLMKQKYMEATRPRSRGDLRSLGRAGSGDPRPAPAARTRSALRQGRPASPCRSSCSWRRWPARRSRDITLHTRRAGFCGKREATSSLSLPSTRRGRSTNSRARSAGARWPNCRAIIARPRSAWCRRSRRIRSAAPRSRRWRRASPSSPAASAGCRTR